MRTDSVSRIFFIGDYPPRLCGIATFTSDLRSAVQNAAPETECEVVAVTEIPEGYQYPQEVCFEIREQDVESYIQAADYINSRGAYLVCVQHEYGIYGGRDGEHILALLETLRIPVVTTLHTVLESPTPGQRRVMREIERLSSRIIVMSAMGKQILTRTLDLPQEKIQVIPHGIPDMPFVDPAFYKDHFGVDGRRVILTFGLLSPNKGIEYVIRALPEVLRQDPDVVYIVLGATHPNLLRSEGEAYRNRLRKLAAELGVSSSVIFRNRFVSTAELIEYIGAADIYITPYLNREQITSGTLSYAFGCGKAVVSTPYWHAEELLSDDRGILVPFRDSAAIAGELVSLLSDESKRNAMRKRAYLVGREMTWPSVAGRYLEVFRSSRRRMSLTPGRVSVLSGMKEIPDLTLRHLKRLTDSVGLFQHAKYSFPNRFHGYCTDDNARAFRLLVLLDEFSADGEDPAELLPVYASFLHFAFDRTRAMFHNFMSFDRRWLDERGSDDCQGRTLQALGTAVRRARSQDLSLWAARLFSKALPALLATPHPRAMSHGLLGLVEYLYRFSGERTARAAGIALSDRLMELYRAVAEPGWNWFEPHLTYANALIPQALIEAGRALDRPEYLNLGLSTLDWLLEIQTAKGGHFQPVGSDGFYPKNGRKAWYDQQPIEASSTVEACLAASAATGEKRWMDEAEKAFGWFTGRNDLGEPLIDPETGGCFDALQIDRVNLNQGAESTLSWLSTLFLMRKAKGLPLALSGAALPVHERIDNFISGQLSQPKPFENIS